jgi:hypothetical protein
MWGLRLAGCRIKPMYSFGPLAAEVANTSTLNMPDFKADFSLIWVSQPYRHPGVSLILITNLIPCRCTVKRPRDLHRILRGGGQDVPTSFYRSESRRMGCAQLEAAAQGKLRLAITLVTPNLPGELKR